MLGVNVSQHFSGLWDGLVPLQYAMLVGFHGRFELGVWVSFEICVGVNGSMV